jgi:hypothetical protein
MCRFYFDFERLLKVLGDMLEKRLILSSLIVLGKYLIRESIKFCFSVEENLKCFGSFDRAEEF